MKRIALIYILYKYMYFFGEKKNKPTTEKICSVIESIHVEPRDEMLPNLCKTKQRGGKEGILEGYNNWHFDEATCFIL